MSSKGKKAAKKAEKAAKVEAAATQAKARAIEEDAAQSQRKTRQNNPEASADAEAPQESGRGLAEYDESQLRLQKKKAIGLGV